MSETTTDPMAEISAMKALAEALSKLDVEATSRVLRWAADRFGVPVGPKGSGKLGPAGTGAESNGVTLRTFKDLSEIFEAAAPVTEKDRALVGGYWFQFIEEEPEFGAQTVNSALKQLGHPVGNITVAFDRLKAQKPALVLQVKKSGTTKQARKKYKLTVAGKNAVELMIGSDATKEVVG